MIFFNPIGESWIYKLYKQKHMKTAMQELIDRLDVTEKQLDKENNLIMSCALFAAKNMAIEALEKEKDQIINAYEDGKENQRESITNIYKYIIGEYYYNQTYNQKQHIIDIMKADEDDGLYNQNK
jgi:predicted patatin/cPLA2 family phospholipase